MTHKTCTVFQGYLLKRTIPWPVISQRLGVDRTAPSKWARGVIYPNKPNADELIRLFGEYGIELDYNDLYQIIQMDEAS